MKTRPNILICREGALGDVLMTTPVVRRLSEMHTGGCNLYVRTRHTEIFRNNPRIVSSLRPDQQPPCRFDVIYNLDGCYEKNNDMHALDAYERHVFGSPAIADRHCELFEDDEDRRAVDSVLAGIGQYIVVHMRNSRSVAPGGRAKDISRKVWGPVIQGLLKHTQASILQVGSAADNHVTGDPRLVDLRGRLNPQQLKVLAERSACYLGSDSGPAHIAACSSASMVILYTIARPEFFQPIRKSGETIAIQADIECAGCLAEMPPGSTSVTCFRGDAACRERFVARDVIDAVRASIRLRGIRSNRSSAAPVPPLSQ
ncbi:MAG: hypothetical protein RIS35_1067 [Pseudomonadota bacterium]